MSLLKLIKQQLVLSATPANNFTFDAGAVNVAQAAIEAEL